MDVTEKYKNMISAFSCDFQLASDNIKEHSIDDNISDIDTNPRLKTDIDLLAELEFKIRYGRITIIEKEED